MTTKKRVNHSTHSRWLYVAFVLETLLLSNFAKSFNQHTKSFRIDGNLDDFRDGFGHVCSLSFALTITAFAFSRLRLFDSTATFKFFVNLANHCLHEFESEDVKETFRLVALHEFELIFSIVLRQVESLVCFFRQIDNICVFAKNNRSVFHRSVP